MIDDCRLIVLPKINDHRGSLSFIESNKHIPFNTRRIYYLYDVPGGSERGGHAHKNLEQLIIAISGSFDVNLDDGSNKCTFSLNRAYQGLYLCSGIWRTISNFSSGAVCLVLASNLYDEDDYIREYEIFEKWNH